MFNNDRKELRLPQHLKTMFQRVVDDSEGRYDSLTHFLKVAGIKLAREEGYHMRNGR